jgi:hypothetical protein
MKALNLLPRGSVIRMLGHAGTWEGEDNLIRLAKLVLNRVERVSFAMTGDILDHREHLLDNLRRKIASEHLIRKISGIQR